MGGICFHEKFKESFSLANKARVMESGVSLAFSPAENKIVLKAACLQLKTKSCGRIIGEMSRGVEISWFAC